MLISSNLHLVVNNSIVDIESFLCHLVEEVVCCKALRRLVIIKNLADE